MKNFETVYKEYQSKILNHVSMRIKNREEAEDLTQEIFIKVYKYLPMYDESKGQFTTWIYSVAKNSIIDYYRLKKMEISDISAFVTDGDDTAVVTTDQRFVTNDNPHTELCRKETFTNVQKRMSKLPKGFRQIADMYFNNQLSYDEISESLEMPLGTVKNNIFRIREILQKELSAEHQSI